MIENLLESNVKYIAILIGILLLLILMAVLGTGLLSGVGIGKIF